MRSRLPLVLVAVLVLGACSSSPSSPSSSKPPTVTTYGLTGHVTNSATGAGIGGATVTIVDGPNAGHSASTTSDGNYSFSNLTQSGFTVRATASYYVIFTGHFTNDESEP